MELKVCRRRAALALVAALALALLVAALALPGAAFAEEEEEESTSTVITATTGTLESGTYILEGDVALETDLTVAEGATVTIDLNGHTLTGTGSGSVITVSADASLTLEDSSTEGSGVITGGTGTVSGSYTYGGGVYVASGATFTMNGGSISGNTANSTKTYAYGGGVYVASGATFTMNGGSITGNKVTRSGSVKANCCGGGIFSEGTVTINGGTISNNSAYKGGGVYSYNSTLTINGGTISDNTATNSGGGVMVYGYASITTASSAVLTVYGGTFTGNKVTSTGYGGAINVSYGTATIYAATITGNTSNGAGGGIYVDTSTTLTIYNVVVTSNRAYLTGGGIWACATGDVKIYVTDGGAVYGNTATGTSEKTSSQAGDDFVSVEASSSTYELSLASRILGGGVANWYYDGDADCSTRGTSYKSWVGYYGDASTARYDNEETHKSVDLEAISKTGDTYALKNVVDEDAAALAEALCTVYITDNTAYWGGGIATNGTVIIGNEDEETTSVTVTKVWNDMDDADGVRPDSVTVNLYNTVTTTDEDGNETTTKYLIETAVLSADNSWTYTFEDLSASYTYTVEESEVPEGYVVSYATETEDDGSTSVTIINTTSTSVTVSKTWDDSDDADGIRPDSATVELYADGEATGLTVTLSEDNGWTASFDDLAAYTYDEDATATEISYTVVEAAVSGYETTYSDVSGSVDEGYAVTITNAHEYVTVRVTVTKTWDDSDDADGLRPDSVTVELYADGEATGLTVTLSEDNGWSASFEDLPVYAFDEDGNATEIEYTVVEAEVDGYESAVTGGASEGYTVTNTHEVTAAEEPGEETTEEEATTEEETTETEESEEEVLASTGDAALISVAVCAAAGAAAVAAGASKRRKRG